MAVKLAARMVEKPWGRERLPAMFGETGGRRIGEIWFEGEAGLPLLAKYIFTSERLSIQVHPDDAQARARGLAGGKTECWLILDAEPGATIGIGLSAETDADTLRAAALDGSIETLLAWRPVRAGDFYFVPAGTVHAIGAGVSLLEFQQNADVTYRLYDYGRPRELHLDDGIAVARPAPYPEDLAQTVRQDEDRLLVGGPAFSLVQLGTDGSANDPLAGRRRWVLPLEGSARAGGIKAEVGECLLLEPDEALEGGGGRLVVGATGPLASWP